MNISECKKMLESWYTKGQYRGKEGFAYLLLGAVGEGKSSVVAQVATQLGVGFIDLRFSQLDSVDFRGIPSLRDGWTQFNPPDFLPFEGSKTADKGILFLDEITLGDRLVRACGYQLINDRAIGDRRLKDGWAIIAATNRAQDKCDIDELPSALRNRFLQMWVENDVESYAAYIGDDNDVTVRYLRDNPKELRGNPENEAFATPRTWARVSRLYREDGMSPAFSEQVFGLIGNVRDSFVNYIKTNGQTYAQIAEQILTGKRVAPLKYEEIEPVLTAAAEKVGTDVKGIAAILTYLNKALLPNKEKLRKAEQVLAGTKLFDALLTDKVLMAALKKALPEAPALVNAMQQMVES